MAEEFGYAHATPHDTNDEDNALLFVIRQMMAECATTKPVIVKAVHVAEDGSGGTVDVLPLVKLVDGIGTATSHGTVFGLPFLRLQAGQWAIVADPIVGDIGLAIVCDRDISNVKASKKESTPGSFRKFDLADGVYICGLLNVAPSAKLELKADGTLRIADAAGNVLQTGPTGFVVTTAPGGDFKVNGISVMLHVHSGVTTGGGSSGPPVP